MDNNDSKNGVISTGLEDAVEETIFIEELKNEDVEKVDTENELNYLIEKEFKASIRKA